MFDENPISPPVKTALVVTGVAAVIGGVIWWMSRPAAAAATPATQNLVWTRVPNGQVIAGQRYRFSIPDLSVLSNQAVSQALSAPFSSMTAYAGTPPVNMATGTPLPADWPKDDPNTGATAEKVDAVAGANANLSAAGITLWQLTPAAV